MEIIRYSIVPFTLNKPPREKERRKREYAYLLIILSDNVEEKTVKGSCL